MTSLNQDVSHVERTCKRGHVYAAKHEVCSFCSAAKNLRFREKYRSRRSWRAMITRCTKPNFKQYKDYGGRGITVCERWSGPDGFKNYVADMGERPSPKHEVDRMDNNLGYYPENCHWVTDWAQSRNRRNNRNITYNGKTQCLRDWATEIGMSKDTLLKRIRLGWSEGRALTTPVDERFASRKKFANITPQS